MAWIIGTPAFFAAELIAQSAWRTPYSRAANAISDLGAVHCASTGTANPPPRYVCSPLHTLVNTSSITLGILLAAGAILTGPAWGRGAVSRTARVLFAVSGAGLVVAALSPEDVNLNLHVLGAFLIMGVGSAGFVLAGLVRRDSQIGRLSWLTLRHHRRTPAARHQPLDVATDLHGAALGPCGASARLMVGRVAAACDQRRRPVDHAVPDAAGFPESGIAG